jgi:hypothetical protein
MLKKKWGHILLKNSYASLGFPQAKGEARSLNNLLDAVLQSFI